MSTIKVDTITTRTGSGNITLSNNVASLTSAGAISGTNLTASGTLGVTGATTLSSNVAVNGGTGGQVATNFSSASTMGMKINDTNSGNLGGMLGFYSGSGAGTLRANIQNANNAGVHFSVGTGGSIVFTQTGYTAANALDDYEEGTFEVVITGTSGGTATGNSGAGAGASYTKIGNTVFYRGYFANPSISGTLSGSLRIALPFTNANVDRFDNGAGGFIVGHREISSGTTSNEITLKTNRSENFARLRRKYTINSRLEDVDLTQGNASINTSTLIWFQGIMKV